MTATTEARNGTQAQTRPPAAGLALERPARPRRLPWALLGVVLVAGSALGFAVWADSLGDRSLALVAAADIDAGQVLDRSDLRTVELAGGAGAVTVPANQVDDLVGLSAVGPVPAGSLITPAMFSSTDPLAANETIVGAVLAPGQFPDSALRPGDTAVLVRPGLDAVTGQTTSGQPLGVATVWSVEPLTQGDSLLVGFRVASPDAIGVTDAAAAGVLRMITVNPDAADDLVAELQAAQAAPVADPGDPTPDPAETGE